MPFGSAITARSTPVRTSAARMCSPDGCTQVRCDTATTATPRPQVRVAVLHPGQFPVTRRRDPELPPPVRGQLGDGPVGPVERRLAHDRGRLAQVPAELVVGERVPGMHLIRCTVRVPRQVKRRDPRRLLIDVLPGEPDLRAEPVGHRHQRHRRPARRIDDHRKFRVVVRATAIRPAAGRSVSAPYGRSDQTPSSRVVRSGAIDRGSSATIVRASRSRGSRSLMDRSGSRFHASANIASKVPPKLLSTASASRRANPDRPAVRTSRRRELIRLSGLLQPGQDLGPVEGRAVRRSAGRLRELRIPLPPVGHGSPPHPGQPRDGRRGDQLPPLGFHASTVLVTLASASTCEQRLRCSQGNSVRKLARQMG